MFSTSVVHSGDAEIGKILAEAIANSLDPRNANMKMKNLSVMAFHAIVRRTMGKTGSMLFRQVRSAFTKSNPYGIEKLTPYTKLGTTVSAWIRKHPPKSDGKTGYRSLRGFIPKGNDYAAGGGFRALMQYQVTPESPKGASVVIPAENLEVGLIPSRRGGDRWATRFRNWQQAGKVLPASGNDSGGSEWGYFGAIGIPLKRATKPKRPARPVINKIEEKERPVNLFQKNFLERLMK